MMFKNLEDTTPYVEMPKLEPYVNNNTKYEYEGKPYKILFEGKTVKAKITGFFLRLGEIAGYPNPTEKDFEEFDEDIVKNNNGSKWIDVVIYVPLYQGCDFDVCIRTKEDFYSNFKAVKNEKA